MIRLLGILSGSALAVVLLITMLGVPNVAPQETVVALPPAPLIETPSANDPAPGVSADTSEDTPRPEPEEPVETATEVLAVEPAPPAEASPAPESVDSPEEFEEHWYAFWSPFHSQLAANGFIAQLQRTTGLDYRVVKLKPGVYEVAFAYADEADIETKLAQISSATGLEMPGS